MSDMESRAAELGLAYRVHSYGDHGLQQISLWEFADSQSHGSGQWLMCDFTQNPCFHYNAYVLTR